MSGEPEEEDGTLVRRVPVIVRSWDGPNSRVGLEMDLAQMPWGPFDALGKRLNLLLPATADVEAEGTGSESKVERALRHVEHAADRCAEFAQIANGNQDLWRRSQETWEWIRRYLTSLWVEAEVDGRKPVPAFPESSGAPDPTTEIPAVPSLPGAAATLKVAAKALRATPLSAWRESMGPSDPDDPTREEAVQTLLGVARILSGQSGGDVAVPPMPSIPEPAAPLDAQHAPVPDGRRVSGADPNQVSFDFATGYDEGYQMGRRVGFALGARKPPRPPSDQSSRHRLFLFPISGPMAQNTLSLAMITEVFPTPPDWERLPAVLAEAKALGAELAILPEIPLNPWSPASKAPLDEDAEPVDGLRQKALSTAASEAGVAVLGGAIIRDPDSGVRHNTALLYDSSGSCLARYKKIHLPAEEGFWETSHYEPGHEPPTVVSGLPMKVGFQVCSDVNRTTGFQLLGAMGAEVVLVPRCTPPQTYERWKLVLRANAVTSGCYVISSNRPAPTPHGLIGGPSIAISPTSEVLLETTDRLSVVVLRREVLEAARADYPGYLQVYPEVYARGWRGVEGKD